MRRKGALLVEGTCQWDPQQYIYQGSQISATVRCVKSSGTKKKVATQQLGTHKGGGINLLHGKCSRIVREDNTYAALLNEGVKRSSIA
jgi:hypothetical protein